MSLGVGDRIRELRKEKGWSQKKLHEESGVAEITIRKYENDADRQPRIEQLQKIADALKVSIAILMEDTPHISRAIEKRNADIDLRPIADMLARIYGRAETKEISVKGNFEIYMLVGRGARAFVLNMEALSALNDFYASISPPFIDRIKTASSEKQYLEMLHGNLEDK